MKLIKSGAYKDKGDTLLANRELESGKAHYRGVPTWLPDKWDLCVRIKGIEGRFEGKSTYDYDFHLSSSELALMVESALTGATNDAAIHAQAKAIGAFIREALDVKHKKPNVA
jgi:hypothetical protein